MNQKYLKTISLLTLVGTLLLTGCVQTHPADESGENRHDPQTAWTAEGDSESEQLEAVLTECMTLVDKQDAEVMGLLGGGRENRTEDGRFLRGRIYEVNVFGENTEVFTVYDDEGYVCCVTMRLKSSDVTQYEQQLRAVFGEPLTAAEPTAEKGVIWTDWQLKDIRMTLFEKGDSVVLELRKQVNV